MPNNSYLTYGKIFNLLSTIMSVAVPLIGFAIHLEVRFDNLTYQMVELKTEVMSLKRNLKCTIMSIENDYDVEVCDMDEVYL